MPIKRYQAPNKSEVVSRTDHLSDKPQRLAREQLLPQIARMSSSAINVVPVYIDIFQRLKTGRRCSCFLGSETDPSGLCDVCFGTAIVGGYQKRGTKQETIDITASWASTNIQADYASNSRPVYWTLLHTAVYGSLHFSVQVNKNIGMLDIYDIKDYVPAGTNIDYYVRRDNETDFVQLTRASLSERLNTNRLHFQVIMRRDGPEAHLPKLQLIRFSYRTQKFSALRADIPRTTESLTMEDIGLNESFTPQTFYLDNTMKNINNEDFVVNLMDGTRWKVTEAQRNAPMNYLLSWDLTARKVFEYEPYARYPAGELDANVPPDFVRSIQTEGFKNK